MSANQKPIERTLVNITDGSRRKFLDDGSDVDTISGQVKSHRVRRSLLLQAANNTFITKGPHKGTPVFYAEEPFAPLFDGDPVARVRVLGAKERKLMDELVEERRRFLDTSKPQAEGEAAVAVASIKRRNTAAAQGADG